MKLLSAIKALGLALACGRCCAFAAELPLNAPSALQVKADSIHYLQNLRDQNIKRLTEIDHSLRAKLTGEGVKNIEKDVSELRDERREHVLRQEFLSRLIFQMDTRYAGGDLRLFLKSVLGDMATNDVTSLASADPGLWKFMKYASEALSHLPEKREDILAFLEGYMQQSMSNPSDPQVYLASRNYTNGMQSEPGRPMKRDDVGAVVDLRLREAKSITPVKTLRKR